MKFRFCGDGDCPDWVLAEIHSSLSVLSSVKLKILTQMVVKSILGEMIPEEKLKETFAANKTDLTSLKSAFGCIGFLITHAIRYGTDEITFTAELQQLGLPKEHTAAICRVMLEHSNDIKKHLIEHSLKVNELVSMSTTIPKDTIDCAQLTIDIGNELIDGVPTKTTHHININKSDVTILLNELRTIKNIMEDVDYEKKYKNITVDS